MTNEGFRVVLSNIKLPCGKLLDDGTTYFLEWDDVPIVYSPTNMVRGNKPVNLLEGCPLLVLSDGNNNVVGGVVIWGHDDIQIYVLDEYQGRGYASAIHKNGVLKNHLYPDQRISIAIDALSGLEDLNKKLHMLEYLDICPSNVIDLLDYAKTCNENYKFAKVYKKLGDDCSSNEFYSEFSRIDDSDAYVRAITFLEKLTFSFADMKAKIIFLQDKHGWSNEELAKKSGISVNVIDNLDSYKITDSDVSLFATAFGCDRTFFTISKSVDDASDNILEQSWQYREKEITNRLLRLRKKLLKTHNNISHIIVEGQNFKCYFKNGFNIFLWTTLFNTNDCQGEFWFGDIFHPCIDEVINLYDFFFEEYVLLVDILIDYSDWLIEMGYDTTVDYVYDMDYLPNGSVRKSVLIVMVWNVSFRIHANIGTRTVHI